MSPSGRRTLSWPRVTVMVRLVAGSWAGVWGTAVGSGAWVEVGFAGAWVGDAVDSAAALGVAGVDAARERGHRSLQCQLLAGQPEHQGLECQVFGPTGLNLAQGAGGCLEGTLSLKVPISGASGRLRPLGRRFALWLREGGQVARMGTFGVKVPI